MPRDTFEKQINRLKTTLLELGAQTNQTIAEGVEALKTRDRVMAQSLIARDIEINRTRYHIEEQAYELIATQQPLAGDLREIIAIVMIAIELERIADHSKNLAEIVMRMGNEPLLKPLIDIPRMAEISQKMLADALDALARRDATAARAVCLRDDELDGLYKQIVRELLTFVLEDARTITRALHLLSAAHNLERIGDRITNIGERVIYAVTGQLEELNVEQVSSLG